MEDSKFLIQPYTPKELAALYRCSVKTFGKWMQLIKADLGPRVGHFYNPKQVRIILERLGEPCS